MNGSQFQERLHREFKERRSKNARYSLRAFATFLGTDHSTLSQILRNKRRIPAAQLRRWARKLGMTPEETSAYIAEQHVPELSTISRQNQLRHWTAEALAIVNDPSHWHIIRLSLQAKVQPSSRTIAAEINVGIDQVNVALSRLLRLRLLEIVRGGAWKVLLDKKQLTESEFRKQALIKVREFAAADGVQLGRLPRKSTN